MKLKYEGWIYAMVLPTKANYDTLMINLHTKYGINIKGAAAVWTKTWAVFNASETMYLNIYNIPMVSYSTAITDFTFWYYATDLRPTLFAGQTVLKKIDFKLGMRVDINGSYLAGFVMIKMILVVLCVLV